MLWFDAFLRLSAITLLLLSAGLSIRDKCCWRPTIFVVLAALGVAGMLMSSAPLELRPPFPVYVVASVFGAGSIVFIWWFGLAIFRDDFRLHWPHWVMFGVAAIACLPYEMAEVTGLYEYPASLFILRDILTLIMMGHLIFTVTREGRDDLVGQRRLSRAYFIVCLVISVLISTGAEHFWDASYSGPLTFIKPLAAFPLALWFTLWLTRVDINSLEFRHPVIEEEEGICAVDPRDNALLDKLRAAMETDKIYCETGLTIRSLSEHLNTPEHRLRGLINQGLGYRNFSAFLNSYRIDAVKTELQDPEKSRMPILTLAMDVGYNSLAPFNRAFRAMEGMTPTDYRQKLQDQKV